MSFILVQKIGMSRIFDEKGNAVAVTAVQADPCIVTQVKTMEKDGYQAVQIGHGTNRNPKAPQKGHTKALGSTPKNLAEFRIEEGEATYEVGQTIDHSVLEVGNKVKVSGTSKGKGFAGVIKRHGFRRGPQTHGSDHHRAPGSIGSMFPQHVWKGKRMPGHAGQDTVTINTSVVDILPDEHVVLLKGALPGSRGSLLKLSVQS